MSSKAWWIVAVAGVLLGTVALAVGNQSVVDQGRPGNQGPWPVSVTGTIVIGGTDGGPVNTLPQPCSLLVQKLTDAGTAVLTVPTVPNASRIYVQICNSILNTSTAQCICAAGSAQPTFSAGSAGDVLATGDCATYNITKLDGGVPWCICNGSNTALSSTECVP